MGARIPISISDKKPWFLTIWDVRSGRVLDLTTGQFTDVVDAVVEQASFESTHDATLGEFVCRFEVEENGKDSAQFAFGPGREWSLTHDDVNAAVMLICRSDCEVLTNLTRAERVMYKPVAALFIPEHDHNSSWLKYSSSGFHQLFLHPCGTQTYSVFRDSRGFVFDFDSHEFKSPGKATLPFGRPCYDNLDSFVETTYFSEFSPPCVPTPLTKDVKWIDFEVRMVTQDAPNIDSDRLLERHTVAVSVLGELSLPQPRATRPHDTQEWRLLPDAQCLALICRELIDSLCELNSATIQLSRAKAAFDPLTSDSKPVDKAERVFELAQSIRWLAASRLEEIWRADAPSFFLKWYPASSRVTHVLVEIAELPGIREFRHFDVATDLSSYRIAFDFSMRPSSRGLDSDLAGGLREFLQFIALTERLESCVNNNEDDGVSAYERVTLDAWAESGSLSRAEEIAELARRIQDDKNPRQPKSSNDASGLDLEDETVLIWLLEHRVIAGRKKKAQDIYNAIDPVEGFSSFSKRLTRLAKSPLMDSVSRGPQSGYWLTKKGERVAESLRRSPT